MTDGLATWQHQLWFWLVVAMAGGSLCVIIFLIYPTKVMMREGLKLSRESASIMMDVKEHILPIIDRVNKVIPEIEKTVLKANEALQKLDMNKSVYQAEEMWTDIRETVKVIKIKWPEYEKEAKDLISSIKRISEASEAMNRPIPLPKVKVITPRGDSQNGTNV